MNENQTDRDEWLAAVEHNRKERIALLELASFMGWEEAPAGRPLDDKPPELSN
jgi:hypothetical protein